MKILIVIVTVLSIICSGSTDNQCSTASSSCSIPYQSPGLLLSCPGRNNRVVHWRHSLRGQNYDLCSNFDNRTCVVRGFQGVLSYDDNGLYYCVEREGKSQHVNVTILGPPKLTNINNYPEYNLCTPFGYRNQCRANDMDHAPGSALKLSVTYQSIAPASVRWFVGDTEIHCPSTYKEPVENFCTRVVNTYNSSTITLHHGVESLAGEYRAVVSNIYGQNTSITTVKEKCTPLWPPTPHPVTKPDINIIINGSEAFNLVGCQISMDPSLSQTICYSSQPNATWSDVNFSLCAKCLPSDLGQKRCTFQLNNTQNLQISNSHGCEGKVSINISGTLNQSGVIFCAYNQGEELVNYTTVHLNFMPPKLNWLYVGLYSGGAVVLVILLVLVGLLALSGYKYRKRLRAPSKTAKRRARREEEREKRILIQEEHPARNNLYTHRPHYSRRYGTFQPSAINAHDEGSTDIPSEFPPELPTSQPVVV